MSLEIDSLYDGQLPATKTVLYTAPAGKKAVIKQITVSNTDTVSRRFILFLKRSGSTSRVIADHDIGSRYTSEWDGGDISLDVGDALEGQSPDGATIHDCCIGGYEETITIPI